MGSPPSEGLSPSDSDPKASGVDKTASNSTSKKPKALKSTGIASMPNNDDDGDDDDDDAKADYVKAITSMNTASKLCNSALRSQIHDTKPSVARNDKFSAKEPDQPDFMGRSIPRKVTAKISSENQILIGNLRLLETSSLMKERDRRSNSRPSHNTHKIGGFAARLADGSSAKCSSLGKVEASQATIQSKDNFQSGPSDSASASRPRQTVSDNKVAKYESKKPGLLAGFIEKNCSGQQ